MIIRNEEKCEFQVGDIVQVVDIPLNSKGIWKRRIGKTYTVRQIEKNFINDYFIITKEFTGSHKWKVERFIKINKEHFSDDLFEL